MSQEQYFRNLVKNLFIQIQIMQNLGLTYDNIVKNCFMQRQNLGLTYGGENGGGKEYGLYVVPADCKVLSKMCTLPKLHKQSITS